MTELTQPIPLRAVVESTGGCIGYICGKCHHLHMTGVYACTAERAETAAREAAERCCHKVCAECSEVFDDRGWTVCRPCRDAKQRAKEQTVWDAARKVPLAEYSGEMVYRDGYGDEGYMYTTDIDDEPELEWVWACAEDKVGTVDLTDYVTETLLESHHEDASVGVDWARVTEAGRLLTEACSGVTSYAHLSSVVVLLPREEE